MSDIKTIVEIIQSIVIILGVVIGGVWALYRFWLQKENEGNIELSVSTTYSPCKNGNWVVFVDTTVKNTGKRTVYAKPKKYLNGKSMPVYEDSLETIYHSCGLQIRRLDTSIQGSAFYDWYQSSNFMRIDTIPDKINLLSEYEISKKGEVEFWLGPEQACCLGAVVTLPPGHYISKVTFVGTSGSVHYCSRIFYFYLEIDV